MKKFILFAFLIISSIVLTSSCQSHGQKCPGMYSQADQVEMQTINDDSNLD